MDDNTQAAPVDRLVISVDFSCRVCGAQCRVAPDFPARAVCEDHCDDHDYEYDYWRRARFCKKCDKQIDPDWWYDV